MLITHFVSKPLVNIFTHNDRSMDIFKFDRSKMNTELLVTMIGHEMSSISIISKLCTITVELNHFFLLLTTLRATKIMELLMEVR